jgi:hypothetical protein
MAFWKTAEYLCFKGEHNSSILILSTQAGGRFVYPQQCRSTIGSLQGQSKYQRSPNTQTQ